MSMEETKEGPKWALQVNPYTNWAVAAAYMAAPFCLWRDPAGPFLITGGVLTAFGVKKVKARMYGRTYQSSKQYQMRQLKPMKDGGMPSSHAVLAAFVAAAYA